MRHHWCHCYAVKWKATQCSVCVEVSTQPSNQRTPANPVAVTAHKLVPCAWCCVNRSAIVKMGSDTKPPPNLTQDPNAPASAPVAKPFAGRYLTGGTDDDDDEVNNDDDDDDDDLFSLPTFCCANNGFGAVFLDVECRPNILFKSPIRRDAIEGRGGGGRQRARAADACRIVIECFERCVHERSRGR